MDTSPWGSCCPGSTPQPRHSTAPTATSASFGEIASDATLAFLTPILGPSATLILHRLGGYASEGDSVWTPHEFAATFGLGHDEHTALAARSLARLVSFSMARIDSTGIAVRTHVGPLPERWAARLPAYLLDAYRSPTAA